MSDFINSLISRHFESGKNVMPRLRGRFEPLDHPVNDLPSDFASSGENLAEQIPGNGPEPKGSRDILKSSPKIPGDMSNSKKSSHPVSLENTYKAGYQDDPGIKNSQPITPGNPSAPIALRANPQIDLKHINGSDTGDNTDSIPLKENRVFITNYNKIIGEEQAINRSTEKTPDLTANVLPDSSDEVKPFIDSREFKPAADKSGGILGEPPGAIILKNISGHPGLETNPSEIFANPVIKVSIGQINVRAVSPPPLVAAQKTREISRPLLSLEDYLTQRGKR